MATEACEKCYAYSFPMRRRAISQSPSGRGRGYCGGGNTAKIVRKQVSGRPDRSYLHRQFPCERESRPATQSMSPFLLGLISPRMKRCTSSAAAGGLLFSAGGTLPSVSSMISSSPNRPPPFPPRRRVGAGCARFVLARKTGPRTSSSKRPMVRLGFRGAAPGSGRLDTPGRWDCDGLPSSSGLQFSLSESWPDVARSVDTLSFLLSDSSAGLESTGCSAATSRGGALCSRPTLLRARLSLGFLAFGLDAGLGHGAMRFVPLGCSTEPVLLDDRNRLMAAMAEPLDSCSACAVSSSSRFSASQANSHACTSRERPRDLECR